VNGNLRRNAVTGAVDTRRAPPVQLEQALRVNAAGPLGALHAPETPRLTQAGDGELDEFPRRAESRFLSGIAADHVATRSWLRSAERARQPHPVVD
jgi:hypothetical protein